MFRFFTTATLRTARRIVVGVLGVTIVVVGLAMLVLPGPGIVVIGVGLALLSLEFAFAQRWLRIVRERAESAANGAGIPRGYRWIIPVAGLALAIPMMILPGLFSVVSAQDGWWIVRNDRFTYTHAWITTERLQKAASDGDAEAVRLLESLNHRREQRRTEEAAP